MKYSKFLALSSIAVIGFTTTPASADGFTPHYSVPDKPYEEFAMQMSADEKIELHRYLDYALREPCQNYQEPPTGFVKDGCHLKHEATGQIVTQQTAENIRISNVITDYEVNFAFDSSAIEPAAGGTLDRVADQIQQHNPREVTVVGHTDKAGPSDYNMTLSQKRAEAVSNALNTRGIENRIIDKEAVGESSPAVDTKDGVALRENRRVVVEFRK